MLESLNGDSLIYEKLSPDEMQKRGILGRLVGVCADFIAPTRNGRKYSESLWEGVFSNPIMQEKIDNKVCFGELGHPSDREEIDMTKAAVCLAEVPKKGKDGKLRAVFDILSTPCGQVLKNLCDYGSTLGISSRGSGDTYFDENGEEAVDESTYNCECFDVVYLPAVKEARLKYVTESLNTKKDNKTLAEALKETVDKADASQKTVMMETLNSIGIDLSESHTPNGGASYIKGESEKNEVVNDESSMISELQESLSRQRNAESQVRRLQEKLSVCYTKEKSLNEEIAKYKKAIRSLSERAKNAEALVSKVQSLEDSLNESKKENEKKDRHITFLTDRANSINKKVVESNGNVSGLSRALETKEKQLKSLQEKVKSVRENYQNEISSLKESIADIKKDSSITVNQYRDKLKKSEELVEKYKATARKAVDKYISVQATRYGISESAVKNKLSNNYSFAEIDKVCESLRTYKGNIDKLPFNLNESKQTKIKVSESVEPIIPSNGTDDSIDESLMSLAGLMK